MSDGYSPRGSPEKSKRIKSAKDLHHDRASSREQKPKALPKIRIRRRGNKNAALKNTPDMLQALLDPSELRAKKRNIDTNPEVEFLATTRKELAQELKANCPKGADYDQYRDDVDLLMTSASIFNGSTLKPNPDRKGLFRMKYMTHCKILPLLCLSDPKLTCPKRSINIKL